MTELPIQKDLSRKRTLTQISERFRNREPEAQFGQGSGNVISGQTVSRVTSALLSLSGGKVFGNNASLHASKIHGQLKRSRQLFGNIPEFYS